MPTLLITGGPLKGRRLRLGMALEIGRQAELSIDDHEISRRHALLRVTDGDVRVEDLGSTNGTWVNGKRVQAALLRPSDQLSIGTTSMIVEADASPAAWVDAGSVLGVDPFSPPLDSPHGGSVTNDSSARRRVASRQAWPTVIAATAIILTAVALLAHFGLRT